ncbi:DNA topoisomerase III alpha [Homo sapiens]|uniref:DNA topoisomerase n=1 Tax=Homo sapiens TaxID=9606 RepID=J3QR18_HUMAN|nr:DNA topoisomerase III alpha [Homo sapiens]KAI4048243.1 DNA topoisomerase III alpha [Homo sapiens]
MIFPVARYALRWLRRPEDRAFSRAAMEMALRGVRKVLCVAEKNDAAKGIADLLSNGRMRRREGLSKFNKIYEFDYHLYGQNVTMVMTSVSGHLLAHDFQMQFRKWSVQFSREGLSDYSRAATLLSSLKQKLKSTAQRIL